MVSIIVPVYNIKEYLPRCVESLICQQGELEILLVDDGSSDGSETLCDMLAQDDARIRVIHKENGGLSDARNVGLDAAKGEWVLFVDGDDYLVPHALQRLMELVEPDADFVQFGYQETEDGAWLGDSREQANPEVVTGSCHIWKKVYALGGEGASSCTKLWNRRVFDGLRFQKGIVHEDEELLNRVLPHCNRAIYTQLVLYGYMVRSGSIVRSGFKPKSMDIHQILENRISVLEDLNCQELVRGTYVWLFKTAAWQYCLAKKAGFTEEEKILKKKILLLAKQQGLELSGQYRLLYVASKYIAMAPELYYFVRRMAGKT